MRDSDRGLGSADPPARGSADPSVRSPAMQDVLVCAKPLLPRRFHRPNLDLPLLLPEEPFSAPLFLDFADEFARRIVPQFPIS